MLIRTRFRTVSIILETISKNAIPSFWYLIKWAYLVSVLSERGVARRKEIWLLVDQFFLPLLFSFYDLLSPPNGPELSCGDVQRCRGSHSARGMSRPTGAGCFARAKSSTAGSVSLSDWLGGNGDGKLGHRFVLRILSFLILSINIAPNYDLQVRFPYEMVLLYCRHCNWKIWLPIGSFFYPY
jgi:hypothetical protein